jgi:outer membrane protein assembly factor BamB
MTDPPTPPEPAGLRRALPSIAVVVSLIASVATVAVAFSPPRIYDDYLPLDGAAASVNGRDGPWWQMEQALITSGSVRQASAIGAIAVSSPRTREEAAARYLRATLAGPAAADAEVLLVADQGSVRFVGAGRRTNSFVTFAPGVVIIAERGQPAQRQTVTMISSETPAAETTVEVTAQEEVDGCREAGFRVPNSGAAVSVRMCRGRGLTAVRWETRVGPVIDIAVSPEPVLTGVGTAELANQPLDWSDAALWRTRPLAWPVPLGEASVTRPRLQAAPVVNGRGQIVVPTASGPDLEAYAVVQQRLTRVWRAHPGRNIVTVTAAGDLTVAATGTGELVAYDPNGLLVWRTTALTGLVAGRIVALADVLTFATLDGSVWRLSSATGEVVWRHEINRPINRGVVADERVVLAVDTAGGVWGWSPDGGQVFSGQVPEPFTALGLDANTVYLGRGARLEGYSTQRSELLWNRRFDTRIVDLCTIGQGAVVATELATFAIAPGTGEILWTAPPAERLECSPDGALLIDPQSLTFVDTVGEVAFTVRARSSLLDLAVSAVAPAREECYLVLPDQAIEVGG